MKTKCSLIFMVMVLVLSFYSLAVAQVTSSSVTLMKNSRVLKVVYRLEMEEKASGIITCFKSWGWKDTCVSSHRPDIEVFLSPKLTWFEFKYPIDGDRDVVISGEFKPSHTARQIADTVLYTAIKFGFDEGLTPSPTKGQ